MRNRKRCIFTSDYSCLSVHLSVYGGRSVEMSWPRDTRRCISGCTVKETRNAASCVVLMINVLYLLLMLWPQDLACLKWSYSTYTYICSTLYCGFSTYKDKTQGRSQDFREGVLIYAREARVQILATPTYNNGKVEVQIITQNAFWM